MAIAFRSFSGAGGGNTAATVSPAAPAGLAENDVCLIVAISGASQAYESVTDSNGVAATQIGTHAGNANFTISYWWYRCPATVPTSFTADRGAGGGQALCVVWAFTGVVTTGTPYEAATRLDQVTTAETTPDTAAITTTGASEMAVAICGVDDDPAYASGHPPSGWTAAGGFSDTSGSDARADLIYQAVASASTVPAAVVGTLTLAQFWGSMTLALLPAAGAATPVAQVTETDLAQPVTRLKTRPLGQTAETDSTQPVTAAKTRAAGQASESDTAQPVTAAKAKPVGQATETDTAQPVRPSKTVVVGLPSETGTAQPVTVAKKILLGQATETDETFAITAAGGAAQQQPQAGGLWTVDHLLDDIQRERLEEEAAVALVLGLTE